MIQRSAVQFSNQTLCYQFFFFFQAEDGIRDLTVTGVQTCALPILTYSLFSANGSAEIFFSYSDDRPVRGPRRSTSPAAAHSASSIQVADAPTARVQIGRASCRERV